MKHSDWKTVEPGRINIHEVAQEIIPGSSCSISPFRCAITIKGASPATVTVSSFGDRMLRALLWALPLAPILMVAAAGYRIGFGAICFAGMVVGVAAAILKGNIDSNFASMVSQGIKKSRAAASKCNILRETLALFATLRYLRPRWSQRINYLVNWNSEDNNMDLYALRPLQEALIILTDLDETKNKKDWAGKDLLDQQILLVEAKLPDLQKVWLRNVAFPYYIWSTIGAISFGLFLCWIAYVAIMTFF